MAAESNQGVRQAIEAANRRFVESFARRDAAGMAAMYTTGGQLLPPRSEVTTGGQAIQGFWQAVMEMGVTSATLETLEVEAQGDTAYEVGRYVMFGSGEQVLDRGKYIVVWRQEAGVWKLHRDIWNSNLPPQS